MGIVEFAGLLISVLTVAVPLAAGGFLWYLKGQFPTKADFDTLGDTVASVQETVSNVQTRMDVLEQSKDDPPTRLELLTKLSQVEAYVKKVEGQHTGLHDQLKRIDDYVQILVERGLKG